MRQAARRRTAGRAWRDRVEKRGDGRAWRSSRFGTHEVETALLRGNAARGSMGRGHGFFVGNEPIRIGRRDDVAAARDRKSTRLNSSHLGISYAVFCLKKKKKKKKKTNTT